MHRDVGGGQVEAKPVVASADFSTFRQDKRWGLWQKSSVADGDAGGGQVEAKPPAEASADDAAADDGILGLASDNPILKGISIVQN